jgi:uncharacterized membrane protein YccC
MLLFHRLGAGLNNGVISAIAALIAYEPIHALSLREGFWAALTTFAVVQSQLDAAKAMALKQFIGAIIGGIVGLCLLLGIGQNPLVYFAAIVISTLACWVLNVGAASPLAGITCTIILLVPPALGTPQHMLIARVLDVLWGICVAVLVVWLHSRLLASWFREPAIKN